MLQWNSQVDTVTGSLSQTRFTGQKIWSPEVVLLGMDPGSGT